jgi:hypothetical protein
MDFLLGLASILPMALFNKSVIKLVPKINPDLTLGVVMIMLFGTAVITIFWAVALQVEVDNSNSFLLGLAASLSMNMGGKILYLLQNPIED